DERHCGGLVLGEVLSVVGGADEPGDQVLAGAAELGFQVKEMLGGFEYWVREGLAYDTGQEPAGPAAVAGDCGC
ncbi:hypothetical protein ACWDAZ_41845, partial [Streptomyces sp. NPDC001215]